MITSVERVEVTDAAHLSFTGAMRDRHWVFEPLLNMKWQAEDAYLVWVVGLPTVTRGHFLGDQSVVIFIRTFEKFYNSEYLKCLRRRAFYATLHVLEVR